MKFQWHFNRRVLRVVWKSIHRRRLLQNKKQVLKFRDTVKEYAIIYLYLLSAEIFQLENWMTTSQTISYLEGAGIFLFTAAVSRPALRRTQARIQCAIGRASPSSKTAWLWSWSVISSVEIKNEWNFTSTTFIGIHGVVLRHSINFNLIF